MTVELSVARPEYTPPTGSVTMFAGATPPSGWLDCDGSAVSRTTYADLFAVVGTSFGVGDGSTTFNLPDMGSRFARGGTPGGTGGTSAHTHTQPTHTHTQPTHTHTTSAHTHAVDPPNTTSGGPSQTVVVGLVPLTGAAATTTHTHDVDIPSFTSGSGGGAATGSSGGDATGAGGNDATGSTGNLPPYLDIGFIIAT